MLNIGFIGFGKSGSVYHAPIVKTVEGLRVKRIITSRKELAQTHFKDALVTEEMEDVLMDSEIDLVIVCTPDTTHFEIARKALEHGKHVVVEKPFVLDSREGYELIRIAKEKGLKIFPYQNRRFDNEFLTAKMLRDEGKLGNVYHFESTFNKLRPAKGESSPYGALFGLGSHLVDQAINYLGKPESVYLDVLEKSGNGDNLGYFTAILSYPDRRAVLRASSHSHGAGPKLIVHGTKGSYIKFGFDPQEEYLKKGQGPHAANWGHDSEKEYGRLYRNETEETLIPSLPGTYQRYYEQVRDAILHGTVHEVTAEDVTYSIHVLEKLRESHQEGCQVRV